MKRITSVNNQYVKDLVKLNQKKVRDEKKQYIVEGYHLVEEALKADVLIEVLTVEDIDFEFNKVTYVTNEIIKKISKSKNPQYILGICKMKETEIDYNNILILDNVQDPGNLGTILRSAVAFGFDNIIMSEDCVDIYNSKVLRSSQGAVFKVKYIKDNLLKQIEIIKQKGISIYGTSLNGKPMDEIEFIKPYAIILGNEGNGVSKEVLDITNDNIYIKIKNTESLNVAIAGSIIMYVISK